MPRKIKLIVRVAVGVIVNDKNEVLIALRPQEKHQGGLWEFPGGKIEKYETAEQALVRELFEEVHIQVLTSQSFLNVTHQYPDKKVLLEVFLVTKFKGQAQGKESQVVRWVNLAGLEAYQFPEANRTIVDRIKILKGEKCKN